MAKTVIKHVYQLQSDASIDPIRTWGGGWGCIPLGSRFFANNFGSNKGTQSKLGDFS